MRVGNTRVRRVRRIGYLQNTRYVGYGRFEEQGILGVPGTPTSKYPGMLGVSGIALPKYPVTPGTLGLPLEIPNGAGIRPPRYFYTAYGKDCNL